MTNFAELVIPIDREWLALLEAIVLPITSLLPARTPYFFTNEEGQILRLRIEENTFTTHKKTIYDLLLKQLQSSEKVKVYKQDYFLEEARFGTAINIDVHTSMFHSSSKIMVQLLKDAESLDHYENRIPYAVIAIQYIFNCLDKDQVNDLAELYMQHWMYFNEQETLDELLNTYQDTYTDEVASLKDLLKSVDDNEGIKQLFADWAQDSASFIQSLDEPNVLQGLGKKDKSYYYTNNSFSQARKWEVIADHIHLLLNRLGIRNEDETLIIFLTQSAMM